MYDFIVIGGGIVGLSTAMRLTEIHPAARLLLLDKEPAVARHQSGHNSGVIHAGVYYAPGSLKARFCLEGNRATKAFCAAHAIPQQTCGKLLVATNPLELERMRALWARSAENGLEREWLSAEALAEREPNIEGLGAILVPSSGIVDYAEVARAMAGEVERAGGTIRCGAEVTAIEERADEVVIRTHDDEFRTRQLVCCAGLMADRVVKLLGLRPDFAICPFRGEYYRLAAKHDRIVNHLIYPIPDPSLPFLGVHLTRMIDGGVTVGPNAVLALKREGYRRGDIALGDLIETLGFVGVRKLLRRYFKPGMTELRNSWLKSGYLAAVRKYCPSIAAEDLLDHPAGVRAQAVSRDGRLIDDFHFVRTPRSFHVCNAPSPAATSAIPIGIHIVAQLAAPSRRMTSPVSLSSAAKG